MTKVETVADTGKTIIKPDVSKYIDAKSASGSKSKNCGDTVALGLQGMTLGEVQEVAKGLGCLKDYPNANPGQVRMFLGNAIRGAVRAKNRAYDSVVASIPEGGDVPEELMTGDDIFESLIEPIREAIEARVAARVEAARLAAEEKAAAKAAKSAKAAADEEAA